MTGITSAHEGIEGKVKFKTAVMPVIKKGYFTSNDTAISVTNANEATIYISIATNFRRYNDLSGDPDSKAIAVLQRAIRKPYEKR